MKKRILVLLSVVALMMVMMIVTVAPAFAARPAFHPTPSNFHATSGEPGTCAVDPVCVDIDVGQSHHESFPQGQDRFQNP